MPTETFVNKAVEQMAVQGRAVIPNGVRCVLPAMWAVSQTFNCDIIGVGGYGSAGSVAVTILGNDHYDLQFH